MASLPSSGPLNIGLVNDFYYSTHNKTFRFGSPEIRCLASAVKNTDGTNNPPASGFALTGTVKLSDMRGKPIPADGKLVYDIPGNYTLPIPIHRYLTVEVNGGGGGGGGWGEEDHGVVYGNIWPGSGHSHPGGNGVNGTQSVFSCTDYYGEIIAEGGTGGPGANPIDDNSPGLGQPTTTAIDGGGSSSDNTAYVTTGEARNGGLCTAVPSFNGQYFACPLTTTRFCFNEGIQYSVVAAAYGGVVAAHVCYFMGGGAGGSGGRAIKTWRHDVTSKFLPWADSRGIVNAQITVGKGGAQGTRGYDALPACLDKAGNGSPGSVVVTFTSANAINVKFDPAHLYTTEQSGGPNNLITDIPTYAWLPDGTDVILGFSSYGFFKASSPLYSSRASYNFGWDFGTISDPHVSAGSLNYYVRHLFSASDGSNYYWFVKCNWDQPSYPAAGTMTLTVSGNLYSGGTYTATSTESYTSSFTLVGGVVDYTRTWIFRTTQDNTFAGEGVATFEVSLSGGSVTPTPTPTVTSTTPTVTPTPTVTRTPTVTQTPTVTPTPSPAPAQTLVQGTVNCRSTIVNTGMAGYPFTVPVTLSGYDFYGYSDDSGTAVGIDLGDINGVKNLTFTHNGVPLMIRAIVSGSTSPNSISLRLTRQDGFTQYYPNVSQVTFNGSGWVTGHNDTAPAPSNELSKVFNFNLSSMPSSGSYQFSFYVQ